MRLSQGARLPPPLLDFPGLSGGVIAEGRGAGSFVPHSELETPRGLPRIEPTIWKTTPAWTLLKAWVSGTVRR